MKNQKKISLFVLLCLCICQMDSVKSGSYTGNAHILAAEKTEISSGAAVTESIVTEGAVTNAIAATGSAVVTEDTVTATGSAVVTEGAVTVTDSAIDTEEKDDDHSEEKPERLSLSISLKQKGKRKVTIQWNQIKQAMQYAVYMQEENQKDSSKKTIKGTQASMELVPGHSYSFSVAALDENGKELVKSKESKAVIPQKVSDVFTCSHGSKKVKLIWGKSEQAERYAVYRKLSTGNSYKKLGQSKKCRYLDKNVKADKKYQYKIVPMAQIGKAEFTGIAQKVSFSNKKIVSVNHQKYSYTEMSKDVRKLKKKYHGIADFKVIGKSEDGRNIYDVMVGNPDAEKSMLVVSTLHAREYMTSLLCMNQVEYYLQNYYGSIGGKKVKKALNEICLHYIPMANPDGVTISQFGISSIKNASLRQKLYRINSGSTSLWKANARGVDLNDNFPYHFQEFGSPGREGYSGKSAASESESRAVISLTKSLKKQSRLMGVLNYHAMGSIVFGSCSAKSPVRAKTRKMYHLARSITGYASSGGYSSPSQARSSSGGLRDYQMNILKIPSITVEVGRISCPGPISEFPHIWNENKDLAFRETLLFCKN